MTTFTEVFDKMNITNNAQLAKYVEEARGLFKGVSVTDLKEDLFTDKLNTKLDTIVNNFKDEADQELLRDIEF